MRVGGPLGQEQLPEDATYDSHYPHGTNVIIFKKGLQKLDGRVGDDATVQEALQK